PTFIGNDIDNLRGRSVTPPILPKEALRSSRSFGGASVVHCGVSQDFQGRPSGRSTHGITRCRWGFSWSVPVIPPAKLIHGPSIFLSPTRSSPALAIR